MKIFIFVSQAFLIVLFISFLLSLIKVERYREIELNMVIQRHSFGWFADFRDKSNS